MSGIFGIFYQDGASVQADDLRQMASLLARRGPDHTDLWLFGSIGLGHTLLTTTPEASFECMPLKHGASGCVITADARLDNRNELLAALDLSDGESTGDTCLILAAYLVWNTNCVERLRGDFAFAIWDPRLRRLFCARDHFGMKPFYYHHAKGRFFAFASEPCALLVLPQVPYRINEGRIADFLVPQLEGINKTSTFFEEVFRLPPAHTLTVTADVVQLHRYWSLEPGPELRLPSDQAYAEAFLDVFTHAVRCRLRGSVGSMLSGGMDSGSVTAVAQELLAEMGRGPLPTFSGTAPDPSDSIETRTIQAALAMEGLDPCVIHHGQLQEFMPELGELTWEIDEPFDNHMTLLRVIYLAAHRRGCRVLLDGAGGDVVLSEGSQLARLLRSGRWLAAYREASGQSRFWSPHCPTWPELYKEARVAFVPNSIRRLRSRLLGRRRAQQHVEKNIRESLINPDFAQRVMLADRLRELGQHGRKVPLLPDFQQEHARVIDHPYLTAGRERYDRVASTVAVEPRDPFLDLRVVALCLSLPGSQKLSGGWPKVILRGAMAGRLPDTVRRRPGKQHLGWAFTSAFMERMKDRMRFDIETNWNIINSYIQVDGLRVASRSYFDEGNSAQGELVYTAAHLACWLRRHAERPQGLSRVMHSI